jgi:hypothetical protein
MDFKSMGYSCSITVGTFVLIGTNVDGALPLPDRSNILTQHLLDFELIDLASGTTMYIMQGCKCGSKDTALDSGALATKNTTWRAKNVKVVNTMG